MKFKIVYCILLSDNFDKGIVVFMAISKILFWGEGKGEIDK